MKQKLYEIFQMIIIPHLHSHLQNFQKGCMCAELLPVKLFILSFVCSVARSSCVLVIFACAMRVCCAPHTHGALDEFFVFIMVFCPPPLTSLYYNGFSQIRSINCFCVCVCHPSRHFHSTLPPNAFLFRLHFLSCFISCAVFSYPYFSPSIVYFPSIAFICPPNQRFVTTIVIHLNQAHHFYFSFNLSYDSLLFTILDVFRQESRLSIPCRFLFYGEG